jgi:hypothetical protein
MEQEMYNDISPVQEKQAKEEKKSPEGVKEVLLGR